MTKTQIAQFLKKNDMKVDELANLADVHRWSLRRFLKHSEASIMLKTADKLELAMLRVQNSK